MDEILKKIAQKIAFVAKREDEELKRVVNQGIFFMPELAFVYACGKEIMAHHADIFGEMVVVWKREVDLGNGGPTDLLFELDNGKSIAIEFKIRDTCQSYIMDIEKLLKLKQANPDKYVTAFCALVDSFSKSALSDKRIIKIESLSIIQNNLNLFSKIHWETIQDNYRNKISCVVCFWPVDISIN